ncbi:unnamed protein product [Ceutorhynchus assimilis]|uniref:SMP-LTD domain-containing protein n=1 Tax=Ceutorhynchus assimilis TaxID=467358 RepID=A0A9P0DPE2_9CUCU|nr:unnamed protein product [Ceutorhynchus assimilis]
MSLKKDGKITLGMLKGKPVTTSVPSISIKFHANAEQIEELHFSEEETPNSEEKSFGNLNPISSSSDQDTSPLKLLPKLAKRSTSVDVSSTQNLSSSPPADPWRFFTDIKGKITKSVEEKITEIKARHEVGSPVKKPGETIKEGKTETNIDSSSFSESEDQSESSISKTCGFASTTEGVEMSSDDETSSIDKEKKLHSPSIIRQKFRFLKHHNHKSPTKEGTVDINNLTKIYNINTEKVEQALPEHSEDVESAVDALEETDFRDSPEKIEDGFVKEEIIKKVAEKIDNIEIDQENVVNVRQISGEEVQRSFLTGDKKMSTVFAPKGFVDVRCRTTNRLSDTNVLPYILLSVYIVVYAILNSYVPYLAGLLLGASLALSLGYVYVKLCTTVTFGNTATITKKRANIMEIPAIKEYKPLNKYEGWVNEYPETYDPLTYHIYQTQSVFLRLQGSLLRLSHSKSKVPKRAMWNEHEIKASFSHHRIYNLLGAKISLLPEGLAKIRLWSKKYPICITLSKDQMNFDQNLLKMEMDDDKSSEKSKSPIIKKKSLFRKREYPYLSQRFSKLTEDQDVDLDSDSRASTPSPEITELTPETPIPLLNDQSFEDDMHSLPDDSSECSQNDSSSELKIYLFGRTDREKEDWFRRLAAATHHGEENTETSQIVLEYMRYMTMFNKTSNSDFQEKQAGNDLEEIKQLWFNALVGRVLFDCTRDPNFTKKVQNRIQKKLQTIKLPYFIEEILITELNLGKSPPFIQKSEKPVMDDRGLWVDMEISYEGSIVLTLQTKLNLMKLKNPKTDRPTLEIKSAIYHSDVDDSAESSSDEEGPQEVQIPKEPTHGKKFIKMVDRIAESKFFQAATENRYIKKAMEGVSNTELRLTVELKALSGTLVLNVPPPPNDRIWVGFRPVPELILTACPIVGDRNVTYTMVTSWIEKKMMQEFQKVMVIPNMEDFLVPVMDPKLPE